MTDTGLTATDSAPVLATKETLTGLRGIPAAAKLGLRLLLKLRKGRLDLTTPDSQTLRFEGREPGVNAAIIVKDFRFVGRAVAGGDIGFGESYMDGDWDTPDLAKLLELFASNLDAMQSLTQGGPVTRFFHWIYHRLRPNTRAGAKRNISAHYDLGNDFYALWLDPSMTYSSARFTSPGQSLEDAQREKYAALARSIDLQPGHHVLEIGCGWGGFAEYAARDIGAKVTCLTLSKEQRDYAVERMERLQLGDKVDIKLQDYRDETGRYDRVASIEMFEAVGEEYWPSFFDKVAQCLQPGGKAGLQIISIRDDVFESYRKRADFIQRYIFPGGILPSVERLKGEFDRAGLTLKSMESFARDYADTLAQWARSFSGAWDDIKAQGFDERFRRMWLFYLAYCEAGFRTERVSVAQYALSR
ncbi:cyclopropane-fatty-acyl-phospholipid synthase family protein [Hyphobacterium marinum]|uniref:Cyclopropane-fatty-acyl-phospholipid synthase family protein n=1 Tax=Hyphobacterium marinum TaxID=3116574 RepID=A0ABU7LYK6_9PROT|nr:cyclopropane-fatty-acyl-phospholipid synthase family protein [Hyphobacterium sp. Y6023]MEE2566638.1 cyclopropane-fatty-acyl-phospholipid synthase family protein [Hyphobacterium sp. Y6023]